MATLRADTAEIPRVTPEPPTSGPDTRPASESAPAAGENPPLRRATGRTGGIVTSTRPSTSNASPAAVPAESVRPTTDLAEPVRPVRTPILPDPADVAAAPPLILPPDADVTLESPASTTAGQAATSAAMANAAAAQAATKARTPTRGPDMHAPALYGTETAAPDRLTVPGMEQPPPDESTRQQRKTLQRRRLVMLLAFVLLAVIVLLVGQLVRGDDTRRITGAPVATAQPNTEQGAGIGEATEAPADEAKPSQGAAQATKAEPTSTTPKDTADTTRTQAGAGGAEAETFGFAGGYGPVLGTSGTLRRFKVAVEKPMGNGGGFSMEVDRILSDPRSWIASRQFRLQRVPRTAASEFTVYLATAKTSAKMCQAGGLDTEGYTSCRLPGQVIINWDRWQDAVPDYDAPLATYRAYAINHEVGHQLGHGHESCPGKGKTAPVMMQQTYGLKGCVANSWPYINGKRYSGPAVD